MMVLKFNQFTYLDFLYGTKESNAYMLIMQNLGSLFVTGCSMNDFSSKLVELSKYLQKKNGCYLQ